MTVNLFEKIAYYDRATNLPIIILMDGWDGALHSNYNTLLRIAREYNVCICSTARRGYANTNGTRDASAREIYDIYDGLQQVRALYPSVVSADKAVIWGASGGGGNALGAACKFPDAWSVVVDVYGMSDYGRDGTNGWHQQNATYRASIETAVGGTPTGVAKNYYARDATAAITNYSGGELFLFHDASDTIVQKVHSDRINTAMSGVGNCTYYLSASPDTIRYTHGHDLNGAAQLDIESKVMATVLSQPAWTIATSGTVTVIGYMVTKRFAIWLNANGTAALGVDAVATVTYNTATDSYTVSPLTGAIDVSITQGAKTGSATNISEATVVTVT